MTDWSTIFNLGFALFIWALVWIIVLSGLLYLIGKRFFPKKIRMGDYVLLAIVITFSLILIGVSLGTVLISMDVFA